MPINHVAQNNQVCYPLEILVEKTFSHHMLITVATKSKAEPYVKFNRDISDWCISVEGEDTIPQATISSHKIAKSWVFCPDLSKLKTIIYISARASEY
jgi:hypothetical protein